LGTRFQVQVPDKRLGHSSIRTTAKIFVPSNTASARVEAIREQGAEVIVVEGNYDEAIARCAAESSRQGWQVISGLAYPGYREIPEWVMEGYGTLFDEIDEQGLVRPDAVFLQAGVGGLACAAVRHYRDREDGPFLVCVEPEDADCLFESASSPDGERRKARGRLQSIMAGLNCGEVSPCAWPSIRAGVDLFLSIEDQFAEEAMRRLYRPVAPDPQILAGESGAAGLAGALALLTDERFAEARRLAPLSSRSSILVINTEGPTDPGSFRRIVEAEP
jgi:diaminopropionate ammonia-lyase